MRNLFAGCIAGLLIAAYVAARTLLWGAAFLFLYNNFGQDAFPALPDLNLGQAIGIGLIFSLLTTQFVYPYYTDKRDYLYKFLAYEAGLLIISPFILGGILTLFV